MSRIGNKPVEIPNKVKVNIDNDGAISVEGPKGKLSWKLPRDISGKLDNNKVTLARSAATRRVRALHGLSRALVHNMVQVGSEGFIKQLEIAGVGLKAAVTGSNSKLSLRLSHAILFPIPTE